MKNYSCRLFGFALSFVCAAFLLSAPVARAQDDKVIKEISYADVERILGTLKIEYEEVSEGNYRFQLEGFKTLLLSKKINLQLYASFKKKTTIARINDWNRDKRYARAYMDKEGDPCLELDLDLEGGSSMGAVKEMFRTWRTCVKLFTEHIGYDK
ncbi:MAG: hypothetical protein QOE34_1618 [Verrucomicrobiota bacterium]|jgi:hypothetical protein